MIRPSADVLAFPSDFVFGVSTSAHQFEGGNDNNNWSDWERRGKIHSGESSGLAADWWRNAERDFDLAKSMGIRGLRLSVEWSRLEPNEGEFPSEPVARYRAMLGALRERGITPIVCLHHFTNPRWFESRGAFVADDAVAVFERFASHVARSFGDLVDTFVTFNEPNVYAVQGYLSGWFPPGHAGDMASLRRVLVTMTRAHAAAYRAIKRIRPDAEVGLTQNVVRFAPEDPRSRLDRAFARLHEATFDDAMIHAVAGAPVSMLGRPFVSAAREVAGTTDFVGLNYYSRMTVAFDPSEPAMLFGRVFVPDDAPQGDRGLVGPYGEVHPEGLGYFVRRYAPLGKPIVVLENGVPDRDDRIRPRELARTLAVVHELLAEGIDLRGYYYWSLVDNFEWSEGWHLRFGLVALDEKTQARRMRPSGELFRAVATSHALRREDVVRYAKDAESIVFGVRP